MYHKKRILLFFMAIIMGTLLIGCADTSMNVLYNNNSEIAKDYNSFSLNRCEETVDKNVYKGKLKLTGHIIIWDYESDTDLDLEVPYKLLVKKGKAKIVLISPDNKVVTLIENTSKSSNKENTSIKLPIKKGNNRIKLVGFDNADIQVELHIDRGTFSKRNF